MIKGFDFYKNKFGLRTSSEIHLGLGRIEGFLESIGNPQYDLKSVHIAGTNGKGSTLQFLKMILAEAGYSVGTFTSPYIKDVTDQISTVDGPIGEEGLEIAIQELLLSAKKEEISQLTDFELLTVLAIVYFSWSNKQDIVLFEAGMGGLTDSTNVLQSLISIITNISLEHTAFLGDTVGKIALQKAGIIKKDRPSVIGVRDMEALAAIKGYANQQQSAIHIVDEDFFILAEEGNSFTVKTSAAQYRRLVAGLKGGHQTDNAALAVMAAEVLKNHYGFGIEVYHIRNGLKKTHWPGRYEIFSKNPTIILDGAHNPDAVSSLADTLRTDFPGRKVKFLFGALRDKEAGEMIGLLEPLAEEIAFADFEFPRAAKAAVLADLCHHEDKSVAADLVETLPYIIERLTADDIFVITGSLYFIAEVKQLLAQINMLRPS